MINLLKKIVKTGTVTTAFEDIPAMPNARGEILINNNHCTKCGLCISSCPTGAIYLRANGVAINYADCIFCSECVKNCAKHALIQTNNQLLACKTELDETGQLIKNSISRILKRSLQIRHVDAGSCNACDFEMLALSNPYYDLQQYGIDFVASPRHADMLMVTGVVTRNLLQALRMTYEATPAPKLVMAVGACANGGKVFNSSYAAVGAVDKVVPVDIYVPGCPPSPKALLHGLLIALDRL